MLFRGNWQMLLEKLELVRSWNEKFVFWNWGEILNVKWEGQQNSDHVDHEHPILSIRLKMLCRWLLSLRCFNEALKAVVFSFVEIQGGTLGLGFARVIRWKSGGSKDLEIWMSRGFVRKNLFESFTIRLWSKSRS